ncbi:MAG: potassium channel family protein [Calothrix sp. MO_167.B12]|nr:potassium channel family protein [Calothrix sp. MO_167.B12]
MDLSQGVRQGVVQYLDQNAFSQTVTPGGFYSTGIYLSFTTLTTLGYGDILPVNPFAMMLTNLEAIIGQMYPAIFIAILVGAYLSQKDNQQK